MEHHVAIAATKNDDFYIECTCRWSQIDGLSNLFDKWHDHVMRSYVDEMEAFLDDELFQPDSDRPSSPEYGSAEFADAGDDSEPVGLDDPLDG